MPKKYRIIDDHTVECPFRIAVDKQEKYPYDFANLKTNKDQDNRIIKVETTRVKLHTGDYSISLGGQYTSNICIERKSKEDLFPSVVKRDNFEGRLERMATHEVAAVVVEAEISEIMRNPPEFSDYNPLSLIRTIQAWTQRYREVHWFFLENRRVAEAWTFRLIENYYWNRINIENVQ